jgi:hypothetical protein
LEKNLSCLPAVHGFDRHWYLSLSATGVRPNVMKVSVIVTFAPMLVCASSRVTAYQEWLYCYSSLCPPSANQYSVPYKIIHQCKCHIGIILPIKVSFNCLVTFYTNSVCVWQSDMLWPHYQVIIRLNMFFIEYKRITKCIFF